MRARLLERLRATREPYFDVLIEHGEPSATAIDVGPEHGSWNHCWSGCERGRNRFLRQP
jgi:hypothetical protein